MLFLPETLLMPQGYKGKIMHSQCRNGCKKVPEAKTCNGTIPLNVTRSTIYVENFIIITYGETFTLCHSTN